LRGKGFPKIRHRLPMPELVKASREEEILHFDERTRGFLGKDVSFGYAVEPEIEGLSVEMVYEKGTLTAASTRGDGRVGELITPNIKTILSVPLTLFQVEKRKPIPELLEVRGIVYMEIEDFYREKSLGNLQESASLGDAAKDALMQSDLRITAKRPLHVFCWGIGEMSGPQCQSHDELMSTLQLWGLRVNRPHIQVFKKIDEVMAHCRHLARERTKFPYPVQGAVIKVNEMKIQKELGEESGRARWAMVFKFQGH
jgi:DNA ligase (NAD+)